MPGRVGAGETARGLDALTLGGRYATPRSVGLPPEGDPGGGRGDEWEREDREEARRSEYLESRERERDRERERERERDRDREREDSVGAKMEVDS